MPCMGDDPIYINEKMSLQIMVDDLIDDIDKILDEKDVPLFKIIYGDAGPTKDIRTGVRNLRLIRWALYRAMIGDIYP